MDKLPLPLTALYAGFMGIFLVIISARITLLRRRFSVGLESSGNKELMKAIRAQGNFIEYVPMVLFLMALAEVNGAGQWMIHFFGLVLIPARILHVHGIYRTSGASLGRTVGAAATLMCLLLLSCLVLYQVFQ